MKLFLSFFVIITFNSFGQSIQRQTVSSLGAGNNISGYVITQTIGQSYQTQTSQSENISLRPGFQQSIFTAEIISASIGANIFPNPATYSFIIELTALMENATLSVFDVSGKLIYSENILRLKKHEIMCGAWANGSYVVKVTDQKGNLISAKVNKIE